MSGIIDFHTHAFPDELAGRAMKMLEEEGDIKGFLDGRVSSLLASMDQAGIEKSIICSIATKPSQFEPILSWSKQIRSTRIEPFPSIHPDDPQAVERVKIVSKEGLRGIKFHPYYQDFDLDEERLLPVYEQIARENLIVVMHTGFDLAFERVRKADPVKTIRILDQFPELKLVTTHMGAWEDWDEVERHIAGKKIYMEISFSLDCMSPETARKIILSHPKDHILFGSDSPWTDQNASLGLLKALNLGQELESLILRENALKLLGSV